MIRPDLWLENGWLLQAFYELSSSRSHGFGANPITTTDALSWLQLNSELKQDNAMFWRTIRVLDRIWLEAIAKKQKAKK